MDDLPRFRVDALSLNLRSEPEVRPATRLAVLPRGHVVTGIGSSVDPHWLMVSTQIAGRAISGFVAHQFLVADSEFDELPAPHGITEVHLREDEPRSRRDRAGGRAFPLGEPDRPTRQVDANRAEKVAELTAILRWLGVETSPRYAATGSGTFCNIYAADYCYLANVYLPRVWWSSRAVARLESGTPVKPAYGSTVFEVNANGLFEWLVEFGPDFGWERVFSGNELQEAAANGGVGIIVAQRKELNRPGHISVVVPEVDNHRAFRRNGEVSRPLQSQAGRTNRMYSTLLWWTHSRFRQFGFWIRP